MSNLYRSPIVFHRRQSHFTRVAKVLASLTVKSSSDELQEKIHSSKQCASVP